MAGARLAVLLLPRTGWSDEGPSFSCARVTSTVNKLIWATPSLAALDRDLADLVKAMPAQPTVDAAALRAAEERWVADLLRRGNDAACIETSDRRHLDELRMTSAGAASVLSPNYRAGVRQMGR